MVDLGIGSSPYTGTGLEKFWVPYAVRHLRRYIAKQKPDLLWIIGYGWSIPVLHRALRDLGIPWHISVHDMADTDGQINTLGAERAAMFQQMLEDLYMGAASRDVYTEEIGCELERVTGKQHDLIIHCGAELEEMESLRNEIPQKHDDKIRIGYPGTIISEDTFARFMAAIKLLPPALSGRVEVHLFGSHSYRERAWYDPAIIVAHGYLSDAELDRRYRGCDWGLAIMALEDSNPRYNRFSFPCKFARALSSGLPVLCLAHIRTTLTHFASKYTISPVISTPDPGAIARELYKIFSERRDPYNVRSEILDCVEFEFNSEKNRKALFCIFRRILRSESLTQSKP